MMAEELYEELPADGYEEELYEDLPDSAYEAANQYPIPTPVSPSYNTGGGAPPPLPTGPIPQHRPGVSPPPPQSAAPPLPTRSPSTAITTPQTTPTRKQEKPAGKPPAKKKAPPPKASKSGGGGGIDMKEILQKARTGDRASALEQLENKSKNRPEDGQSNPAPWANALRKTGTARPKDEESNSPPPWVKRSSQAEMDAPNQDDETPEFIRKARTLSRNELEVKKPPSPEVGLKPPPTASKPPPSPRPAPKPAAKPPPVAKPRNIPNPEGFQPKVPNIPAEDGDKPAWQKQRERQVMLAKGEGDEEPAARPPPPATKPPPSNKPAHTVPNGTAEGTPPPISKKPPPPKPAPRKHSEVPAPINIQQTSEPISQESPPTTPSVRERAKTLERGAKQRIPTPPESPVVPVPPRGGAVSDSPPLQPSPHLPPRPGPKAPAPAPPPEEEPPKLPDRPPPSTRPPPPTSAPPPSSVTPPLPDRPPPSSRPPVTPPIEPTQTFGEPTPPVGMVMKYRRRPLRSVDPFSPPARPPASTKPQYAAVPLEEEDEIYDDTVALQEDMNGETEELYDDVTQTQQLNAPSSRPLPPTSPPPGPPSDVPPPLPASLPPSARPSVSTLPPDDMPNGITSPSSNGDFIPPDDQETYEDLESAAEAYQSALLSHPQSASSLAPPSPQHTDPSPSGSPTLGRKNKLTKEEKKAAKEEERKRKEREKLEKEREKERKKKEEARMKNRVKGLKAFKQFELKPDVEPLFAVEVLLEHPKTKDHLNVSIGEVARVLLIGHAKLPTDRYLIEKEDGTIGYLKKNICQRTAYQSAASILDVPPQPAANAFQIDEDIYESLPQGDGDEDFPDALGPITPSLPPPNPSRFPPPSQPAPPPPMAMDGPEDNYEYLPEPQAAN